MLWYVMLVSREAIDIEWWGKINDAVIAELIGLFSRSWRSTLNCLNWILQNKRERGIEYIRIQKSHDCKGPADVIHMHIARNSNHSRPLVYSASRRLGAWLAHAEGGIHGGFRRGFRTPVDTSCVTARSSSDQKMVQSFSRPRRWETMRFD